MMSCVVTFFLYLTVDQSLPDGQNNKCSFSISGATCSATPHTSFGVERLKVPQRRLAKSCRDSPLLKPSASGKLPPLLLQSMLKNKPSHMLLMVCPPPANVDAAANMGVPVIASTLPVGLGMSSKLATSCIHDYVKVVCTDIIIPLNLATCHFSQVCQCTNLTNNAMLVCKWQVNTTCNACFRSITERPLSTTLEALTPWDVYLTTMRSCMTTNKKPQDSAASIW